LAIQSCIAKSSARIFGYFRISTGASPTGGSTRSGAASPVSTGLGVWRWNGRDGAARPHVTFYVEVAGIKAALALNESRDGEKALDPHPGAIGAILTGLAGPEGNLIGLVGQPMKQ